MIQNLQCFMIITYLWFSKSGHHLTSRCLSPGLLHPCRTTFLSFFQVYKHTKFFPSWSLCTGSLLDFPSTTTQLVASFHPLGLLREAFPSILWKVASFPYSVSQSMEPVIALTETWNRFTCFFLCPLLRMYDRLGQGSCFTVKVPRFSTMSGIL